MESGKVIMVVGTDGAKGNEEEWNRWYNERHVPDILKYPGVESAARFIRVIENDEGKYPKYLAIYEFKDLDAARGYETSPERDAAMAERNARYGKGPDGTGMRWRVRYQAFKTWQK